MPLSNLRSALTTHDMTWVPFRTSALPILPKMWSLASALRFCLDCQRSDVQLPHFCSARLLRVWSFVSALPLCIDCQRCKNSKFKERKEEKEQRKRRQNFPSRGSNLGRQRYRPIGDKISPLGDRTWVASVIDQQDNHYTTPTADSISEIRYLYMLPCLLRETSVVKSSNCFQRCIARYCTQNAYFDIG